MKSHSVRKWLFHAMALNFILLMYEFSFRLNLGLSLSHYWASIFNGQFLGRERKLKQVRKKGAKLLLCKVLSSRGKT